MGPPRLALLGSFHARLLLALALLALIPLAVVGLGGAELERRTIAEESARELTGLARGLAGQADVYMDPGPLADLRAMAVLPDVVSMDPARQDWIVKTLYQQYPQFARMGVYAPDGTLLVSSHPDSATSVAGRVSFQRAIREGRQAWEVGAALSSGRPSLLIYSPIRDQRRRVIGALGGVVDLATLGTAIGRVPVGEGGRAFIVDADGRVLVHPDASRLGQHWLTVPPGPGTTRYARDGETWIAGYAPVPSMGWTMVAERPEAEVLAPAERSWRLALAALGVTAVIVLVAAVALARLLTTPLVQLADAARAFGAGDLEAPLPRARGEIGELVGAFASMRAAVAARTEALREERQTVETLHGIGTALAAELEPRRLAQIVTDAATEVVDAEFGAFSYNAVDERGEPYQLSTHSGASGAAGERLPTPTDPALVVPSLGGEGVVRIDDLRGDPRLGPSGHDHGSPTGARPVVSYLAVPVVSRSGELLGRLVFGHSRAAAFTDRAERLVVGIASQAAIALDNARLYQQTRAAVAARDDFLSIAAHELKTPVTSIRGIAQLLLRKLERNRLTPEDLSRSLTTIDRSTARLARLVNDLLDVSRLQIGRLDLNRQPTDVAALTAEVVERYRDQLGETHNLRLDLPSEGAWASVDRDRVEQVLTNLIDNAAKYSPEGGTIVATVRPEDDAVTIEIRDRGIGLPEGSASAIFEPFGRATNAVSLQVPGMGLGLYICRNIIERHEGQIWAESGGEGTGTRVVVRLPASVPAPAANRTVELPA